MARKQVINRAVEAEAPAEAVQSGKVKVRALGYINESGTTYKPGDEFEVDSERVAAIAGNVELVK